MFECGTGDLVLHGANPTLLVELAVFAIALPMGVMVKKVNSVNLIMTRTARSAGKGMNQRTTPTRTIGEHVWTLPLLAIADIALVEDKPRARRQPKLRRQIFQAHTPNLWQSTGCCWNLQPDLTSGLACRPT